MRLTTENFGKLCALKNVELDGWLQVLLFFSYQLSFLEPVDHLPLDILGWPVIEVICAIGLSNLFGGLRSLRPDLVNEVPHLRLMFCTYLVSDAGHF